MTKIINGNCNIFLILAVAIHLLLLTTQYSYGVNSKDTIVFRDNESNFIFQYPSDWAQVPSTHTRTKIKVVSDHGNGTVDCAVNVQYDKKLVGVKPKEFIRTASNVAKYQERLRKSLPDAKVVDSGKTYISNQEAFYTITEYTFRSVGIDLPVKMITVQTAKKGHVYTLSCRSESDEFDEIMPMFQIILSGFLIKP